MDHGPRLSQRDARQSAGRAAEILAGDPRVRLVFLFGSAAAADARDVRDIDLAVLTEPPLSLNELMWCRADLVAATRAPIDLVSLNAASIALAREVVDRGICLFARNPDVETDFVTRARARYWPAPLFDRLKGLGGFRNILVHGYLRLDPEQVREHLRTAPTRFSDFAMAIRRWLVALG